MKLTVWASTLFFNYFFLAYATLHSIDLLRSPHYISTLTRGFSNETGIKLFNPQHELVDSQSRATNGTVMVLHYNRWGYICADQWTAENAKVVCRQLGFTLGSPKTTFVTNSLLPVTYLYQNVDCKGHEAKIQLCDKQIITNDTCAVSRMASVECRGLPEKECGTDEFQCFNEQCIRASFLCDGDKDCKDASDEDPKRCKMPLEVRLVGGANISSGRVEIRYHGVWGTICDDSWDNRDAMVICKMLGLSYHASGKVIAQKGGHFGSGTGLIWLDNINCRGNEDSIEKCPKRPWGRSNCDHTEDAGVICGHSLISNTPINKTLPATNFISIKRHEFNSHMCGQRYPETNVTNLAWLESSRVVGGHPALPGTHPWQAAIRLKSKFKSIQHCGAAIIAEYFVLSAAHCVSKYSKIMYIIRVGDYLTEEHDLEEEEFSVDTIYVHEKFRHEAKMNNDIAIIRIKPNDNHGIKFGRRVQPICLPSVTTTYQPGKACFISGWGQMEFHKHDYPERLQESEVPILPWEVCRQPQVYGTLRFTENMFCAGYLEGGIDACKGDSGGPLVCLDQGQFVVFGVISWGDGCGMENRPGVYTNVQVYLEWIRSKMTKTWIN